MQSGTIGRVLRGTVAVSVCVVLAGCAQVVSLAPTTSAPPATAAPVFTSEAEALAAARESYSEYLALSAQVGREGGASPDRMSTVMTGEALTDEIASFHDLASRGVHGVGEFKFDSLKLQSADLIAGNVTAYLCLDVSTADLIDETGASTVPPGSTRRFPLSVAFTIGPQSANYRLVVEKSESWSGANFC